MKKVILFSIAIVFSLVQLEGARANPPVRMLSPLLGCYQDGADGNAALGIFIHKEFSHKPTESGLVFPTYNLTHSEVKKGWNDYAVQKVTETEASYVFQSNELTIVLPKKEMDQDFTIDIGNKKFQGKRKWLGRGNEPFFDGQMMSELYGNSVIHCEYRATH